MYDPREVIAMPAPNRNETAKHLLSTTGRQHLQTIVREIEGCQIIAKQKQWDYNDFVNRVLEVIVTLRLREKRKNYRHAG
jgi:hypothetical protein